MHVCAHTLQRGCVHRHKPDTAVGFGRGGQDQRLNDILDANPAADGCGAPFYLKAGLPHLEVVASTECFACAPFGQAQEPLAALQQLGPDGPGFLRKAAAAVVGIGQVPGRGHGHQRLQLVLPDKNRGGKSLGESALGAVVHAVSCAALGCHGGSTQIADNSSHRVGRLASKQAPDSSWEAVPEGPGQKALRMC
jgi:hypothetical protein